MKGLTAQNVNWLRKYVRDSWHLEEDGRVSVKGNVTITDSQMEELPVEFANISGIIKFSNCSKLISVKGFPDHAGSHLEMENCLFPSSLYMYAYTHKKTLQESIQDNFELIVEDSKVFEAVKLTFPDICEEKRGFIASKRFGF